MTAIVAGAGPGIGPGLRRGPPPGGRRRRDGGHGCRPPRGDGLGDAGHLPPGPRSLPIAFDFADLASCQALVEQTLDRLAGSTSWSTWRPPAARPRRSTRGEWTVVAPGLRGQRHRDPGAEPAGRPGHARQTRAVPSFRSGPSGRGRSPRAGPATRRRRAPWSPPRSPWPRRSAARQVRVNVVTPGFVTGAPLSAMIESIAPAPARAPTRCPPAWRQAHHCGATSIPPTSPRRSSSSPVPGPATSPAGAPGDGGR